MTHCPTDMSFAPTLTPGGRAIPRESEWMAATLRKSPPGIKTFKITNHHTWRVEVKC